MEAILVKPRDEKQESVLVSLFEEMGISFRAGRRGTAEGDRYWPALDEKIREALRDEKEGRAVSLDMGSFDGFLNSIQEHGRKVQG